MDAQAVARAARRTLAGLLGVIGALALASFLAREPLERIAGSFMAWGGWPGLFAGVYLADGFHLPPPPQFHLLVVVTAGLPVVPALLLVCTASLLGGLTSYGLGRWLGGRRWAEALMAYATPKVAPLFRQKGAWTVVVAAVTPVPFSSACFLSGAFRMRASLLVLMLLLRIPRLLVFYAAIRAGWSIG